jgi:anaerobic ribonucleoside-triphosphate reductase activating protein
MTLRLSRVHFPVTTLGPGQRIGIWFQGCSIRCPGCISVDTWSTGGSLVSVAELLQLVSAWPADGITISGGEPFDQPDALIELLGKLRQTFPHADILVYSGYPREKLSFPEELIDALMSDPFLVEEPQTLALRGSDNQRLHLLTQLGRQRFASYQRARTSEDDKVDLMADPDGTIWMAGIPRRGDLGRLQALLSARGTLVRTSEGKP